MVFCWYHVFKYWINSIRNMIIKARYNARQPLASAVTTSSPSVYVMRPVHFNIIHQSHFTLHGSWYVSQWSCTYMSHNTYFLSNKWVILDVNVVPFANYEICFETAGNVWSKTRPKTIGNGVALEQHFRKLVQWDRRESRANSTN